MILSYQQLNLTNNIWKSVLCAQKLSIQYSKNNASVKFRYKTVTFLSYVSLQEFPQWNDFYQCGSDLCAQDQAVNGHGMIFDFPCISLQIKVFDLLIEA